MTINSIFRKASDARNETKAQTIRAHMTDYARQFNESVRLIAAIEALLELPCPPRDPKLNSSLTLQPMADYHPEGSLRIVFDNVTMQPIGAEILVSEGSEDANS